MNSTEDEDRRLLAEWLNGPGARPTPDEAARWLEDTRTGRIPRRPMPDFPHDHKPLTVHRQGVRATCTDHYWSRLDRDPEHGWRVVPELVSVKAVAR